MVRRIEKILERWFILEPPLFQVLCLHELAPETSITCPLRSGRKRLEYNPDLLVKMTDAALEESLKLEAVRILLKHPYERFPDGCCLVAAALGSNVTVGDNYAFSHIAVQTPADYRLDKGQYYEWYAMKIQELLPPAMGEDADEAMARDGDCTHGSGENGESNESGNDTDYVGGSDRTDGPGKGEGFGNDNGSETGNGPGTSGDGSLFPREMSGSDGDSPGGSSASDGQTGEFRYGYGSPDSIRELQDLAELWDEDAMMACQINNVIESTRDWGSMPGNLQQVLKASLKAKIDWRKILSGFRASILSSERKLTRMRPNRRTGFANMGGIRRFNTKLLVAVDVSGSVSDKSVSDFYGVVNSAFRYGFESVDVLQFDHGVHSVVSLTKAVKDFKVCGRGGTSFQEPVDYAHENGYEGLVILTDGYAPAPMIPDGMKAKILWVCVDRESYDEHKDWMSKSGRVCTMQLRK